MENLLPSDLAAQERYGLLTSALGGEPEIGFHRAMLARLSAWTDREDISALAGLIRQAIEPYRSVVAELVPVVRRSRETNDTGALIIAVPQELARQLVLLSTEERQ